MKPNGAGSWLVAIALVFLSAPAAARASVWHSDSAASSVTLAATCDARPCGGVFRKFRADIVYAPTNLADAKFDIRIDVASLAPEGSARTAAAPAKALLAAEKFPGAYLATTRFHRARDGRITAASVLKLHGVVAPVAMDVAFTPTGPDTATLDFVTRIRARDFGMDVGRSAGSSSLAGMRLSGHLELRKQGP